VVNMDLLSNQTSALTPVGMAVQTAVVRLGRLITNKLLESGNTQIATLLACEQGENPSQEEHELYLTHLDCALVHNFRNLTALSSLGNHYAAVEDRLLALLAQRARRELNTISEDPPFATRLALETENLLAISPLRGSNDKKLNDLEKKLDVDVRHRMTQLLTKPTTGWSDIMKAQPATPASDLIFWANSLSCAVSAIETIVYRLDPHFNKDPAEEGGRGNAKSYRQLIRQKYSLNRQSLPLHSAPFQRLHGLRWEDDAARLLMERHFYEFALLADNVLLQIQAHLEVWDKNEIHRSARVKSRQINTENFFYADGIRRSLYQLGESLDDAMTCAEKLLQYCSDSGVTAAELIDDEIWSLYPRINRENLKQARLRVRHSDDQFPLSVAHREWISGLTERALAKRAQDGDLTGNLHLQAQVQTHRTSRQS
jgi:hypothetical protein